MRNNFWTRILVEEQRKIKFKMKTLMKLLKYWSAFVTRMGTYEDISAIKSYTPDDFHVELWVENNLLIYCSSLSFLKYGSRPQGV